MALQKDRIRENVKGGGVLKIREIYPNATNTFSDLGYLNGTDFKDERTENESMDEAGNFINVLTTGQKVTIETVLKQTSIDEINLLKNSEGKYYDLYYSVKLQNGNTQELSIPLCKLKAGVTLSFKPEARTLPLTIYALAPKSDYTRTPTDYNVTVNVPYTLIENATAKGVPTDTASALATAIL